MDRVLVIGTDSRPSLAIIRSLGRAGLKVETALIPAPEIALKSRYVSRHHPLERVTTEPGGWLTELNRIVAEGDYRLIIPCNDGINLPLQLNRTELVREETYFLLPDRVFEITFHKDKTAELAASLGIRTPRSRPVEDIEEGLGAARETGFPVVLKPRSSFNPANLKRRLNVGKAYSAEELEAFLPILLKEGPLLIQENLLGSGVGVEVLAKNGRVLTGFQHLRVHEPILGGMSSYRKAVPLHPELFAAAEKMIKALDYTGVAMFEYKLDQGTGIWALLEINARFWGSLPLPMAAGIDFPYFLYQLLVEGRTEFPREYRTGLHARYLPFDLAWLRDNLRADRSDPTLATRPLWRVAAEVFNLLTLRERNDTWVSDDLRPGLAEAEMISRRIRTKIGDKLNRALIGRRMDAEKRKAKEALARAEEVLFLCLGNICRSPFARGYAAKLDPGGRRYTSSGYLGEPGRSTPGPGIEAAAELGVDLTAHRSGVLDRALVERSDLIFVHDAAHWRHLANTYPEARAKVFYLGLFGQGGGLIIDDPFGGGVADYRRTYGRIASALDELLDDKRGAR